MVPPQSSARSRRQPWLGLIVWLLITFVAAAIGNVATLTSVGDWYQTLAKPALTPPDCVFGPVWTALYLMMALAAWLVWRQRSTRETRWALALFVAQLVLNVLWSVLFFGLRSPSLSAVEIVLLWLMILATLVAFARHSAIAAALLAPYLAWVTFAAYLNFQLAALNP
jgi:tryptophan-rich sensory protein